MRRFYVVLASLFLLVLLLSLPRVAAQQPATPSGTQAALGTAFTYQGRLSGPAGPVNNPIALTFRLYDAESAGRLLGTPLTQTVTLANGLFTTPLDFGQNVFTGEARWLEIEVAGITLMPRHALTPVPYALYAPQAGSAQLAATVPWSGITGMPDNFADGVDNDTTYSAGSGLRLSGTTLLLDTSVTDARYWRLGGNSGTSAGTDYMGTSDNVALELKVSNTRAFRVEPTSAGVPNIIAGWSGNTVTPGAVGGTISGGGQSHFPNLVTEDYSTVGGGSNNRAGDNEGSTNQSYATVGGGWSNTASRSSATVGGGWSNTASGGYATVGGGGDNIASGSFATVGGGESNTAAGDFSFVVGHQANNSNTAHAGVFLFADSTFANFDSVAANEFAVRATGGVRLRTRFDLTTGCNLAAGSGTWACTSDRNAKTNFASIDPRTVLEALAGIPMQSWSYQGPAEDVRHIGPVAQDFYAAFGLGEGDTTISMVDADGVNMAAIQGLYQIAQEKDREITGLKERMATLEQTAPGAGPALPTWLLALFAGAAISMIGVATMGMLLLARRLRRTEAV